MGSGCSALNKAGRRTQPAPLGAAPLCTHFSRAGKCGVRSGGVHRRTAVSGAPHTHLQRGQQAQGLRFRGLSRWPCTCVVLFISQGWRPCWGGGALSTGGTALQYPHHVPPSPCDPVHLCGSDDVPCPTQSARAPLPGGTCQGLLGSVARLLAEQLGVGSAPCRLQKSPPGSVPVGAQTQVHPAPLPHWKSLGRPRILRDS